MDTITVTSDHAHKNWRETMDAARTGQQAVVIEQQGQRVATLVNYELFQRMKRALIILQGLKQAEQNRQTRLEDPSSTVTLTQLAAKLNLASRPETTSSKTPPTSQS